MSFSGRLNNSNQDSSNVVPLSISSHYEEDERLSLPLHTAVLSRHSNDLQKQILVEDLIECKAQLLNQTKAIKQLKEAHEAQLVAVSRQLLELECGLRKRERELCATLQQRDRVIHEQSHIIRFLTKKTGTKRRDILKMADEAAAKIPQILDADKAKSELALTSILESESENDSAIILDDNSANVSRSVSDVDNKISSPFSSPNYRGFLLRHGSYERYKIRSRMFQLQQGHHLGQHEHQDFAQVAANATLPRSKKKDHPEIFAVSTSLSKELNHSTVIVIGENSCSKTNVNTNHRNVTKPRDVKNKSNRTKMILKSLSTSSSGSASSSKSPSPPILISDKFVRQSGSVYCSLYGDLTSEDEHDHYSLA